MVYYRTMTTPAYLQSVCVSLSELWHVQDSLMDTTPIQAPLTPKQLVKVALILQGKFDLIDNMRIFAKLLHMGFVLEITHKNEFVYILSENAKFNNLPTIKPIRKICPKCNGKGIIPEYGYIAGGICFACNGKGTIK